MKINTRSKEHLTKSYIGLDFDFSKMRIAGKARGFSIFNYTLVKMLRSPSTIFFLVISFILTATLLYIGTNVSTFTLDKKVSLMNSTYTVVYFTMFLCGIFTIFLATKCSQTICDEIEEGTFLVVLSKPISRLSLLLQKWLSFQLIGMVLVISVLLFDSAFLAIVLQNDQIFEQFIKSVVFIFIFSIIYQLLFSSIFFIISFSVSSRTLIIIAALTSILLLVLNVIIPLFTVNNVLQIQKGIKQLTVSNDLYPVITNEINTFGIIAIFDISYQLQTIFHLAQTYFGAKAAENNEIGSSGFLSQFDYFEKPNILPPQSTGGTSPIALINGWSDFINAWVLLGIYLVISAGLLVGTYYSLINKDFR
ncbi:hypothetical protein ASO20_02025 [Mycoplasma sp. (ex Biomphalaria glabrata)]|uniref:ABC transporter permease n=1 Tax=Mycoplasma sp. (ex Biomphalaria glabrata) TaxID=1749074 RepID=UPI00073AC716|nr:ABC transporter permease subunit [Mycoplasma sp. (ex Biomphalaria glabrata)]ALV23421.1 hypothetical protein ASO20_02025 [Mycoplasma sp. (ex Biomphalaria glabrata)]